MLKIKNELLSYVVGDCQNSRAHSACIQTTLLDGNQLLLSQLLLSFTKLTLLSSSIIAEVNALERFLEIKIEGTLGFEPVTSRTAAECSTLSYIPLNSVNRQSTLSLRVYMELVRKRSCLVLLWFFSLPCSENQPSCFKFQFPRRESFWRRNLAYRK